MAEKKTEKVTLREALRDSRRGCGYVMEANPGLFPAIITNTVAKSLAPYVGIWFSARILTELAGERDPDTLRLLVILTLVTGLLTALICGVTEHWRNSKEHLTWYTRNKVFQKKFLAMDFADVDSAEVRDLRAQIDQNDNWMGSGLRNLIDYTERGLGGLAAILGAVVLTVSLFTQAVPDGSMSWLNSLGFLLGFVALLLLGTVIPPLLRSKAGEYWTKGAAEARMGNRYFMFFGFMAAIDRHRALDIRMYEQEKVCASYAKKGDAFHPGGYFPRMSRGRMGLLNTAAAAFSVVVIGLVYVFVCLKAWAGAFGVGQVAQYIGAVTALSAGLAQLFQTLGNLRNNTPFLKTAYEFLDIPNKMYQGSLTTEKRNDRQYDIEFRDVSFKYPGTDTWALRHVNMKFRVGSRLVVVGENGSGKTTFIKLLCRLYDPDKGEILLNGIDIRKYNYRDYINVFSVVFQDFQLLSQPLGENVAGSKEVDKARVLQALKDAGFDDRMESMKDGLDTQLYKEFTEDGVEVSGGEAQKIAIARALYKDAPFIILDEPTAALDPIAEAEIYSKFNDIAGDKTAIYISHRLSSCKFCDEIAVFDHGRVVQMGGHESLLAEEGGKYHELWNAQAQYYVEETAES